MFAEPEQKNNVQQQSPVTIQPKLEIGAKDDAHEKEADEVAGKVLRMSEKNSSEKITADKAQPNYSAGSKATIPSLQKKDDEKEEKVHMKRDNVPVMKAFQPNGNGIQLKSDSQIIRRNGESNSAGSMTAPAHVQTGIAQSKGEGQSLPGNVQNNFGEKMGVDLSGVKIHTDSNAHQMSTDINAKAFTHGKDIYFKQGNYNPESNDGKHLLVHELTHTVQNGAAIRRQTLGKAAAFSATKTTASIAPLGEKIKTIEVSEPIKHVDIWAKGQGTLMSDDSMAVDPKPCTFWTYSLPGNMVPSDGQYEVTITLRSGSRLKPKYILHEPGTYLKLNITSLNSQIDTEHAEDTISMWRRKSLALAIEMHDWSIRNYGLYFGDTSTFPETSFATAMGPKFKKTALMKFLDSWFLDELKEKVEKKVESYITKKIIKGIGKPLAKAGLTWIATGVGTAIAPGIGTVIGFIVGVILDLVIDWLYDLFGDDEQVLSYMQGSEATAQMIGTWIASTTPAMTKQVDFINVKADNAIESIKAAQSQDEVNELEAWFDVSKFEATQSLENFNFKSDESLHKELLATWVMENASTIGSRGKYSKDIKSEQWNKAFEKLNSMDKNAFPSKEKITGHSEMFAHQFMGELRRLGVDEADGEYILNKVNKMKGEGKSATDIKNAFSKPYEFVIRPTEIKNPEKFIKQVNTTSDWAYMTEQGKEKVRAGKDVYLNVGFDLKEDEGSVYVTYFNYGIHFKNWDQSRGGWADYNWYESL